MPSIANQVAIVTGAGRGIGRAIASELGRLGAKVVLAARSSAELEAAAKDIQNARVIPTDVRRLPDVQNLFDRAAAAFGPVDILVNAAGIGVFAPVSDFKDDDYDNILETNLRGIFYTTRAALQSMMERRTGYVVNIASIAGKVGSPKRAVYCASKFGVVGFSQSVAEEVREYGIRVSVVCPGSTDTAFSSDPRREGKTRSKMLLPGDVASVVGMLLTQEANSFISEVIMRPTQKP
jgi:3-oxoacyl-[acyl-carrier protein] reductase